MNEWLWNASLRLPSNLNREKQAKPSRLWRDQRKRKRSLAHSAIKTKHSH